MSKEKGNIEEAQEIMSTVFEFRNKIRKLTKGRGDIKEIEVDHHTFIMFYWACAQVGPLDVQEVRGAKRLTLFGIGIVEARGWHP